MSTIIALTNQKGGVGKTTTSSALATRLAMLGYKVLGIDLDPQGNFGFCLGLELDDCPTIYDVFKNQVSIEEAIQHTEHCDIIGSDIMLSTVELEFNGSGREHLLKNAVSKVEHLYDFIIIDTPPSLNILTVNAYVTSQHLILPMAPEILSLVGIVQIKETIESVRNTFNPSLSILGILLNKFNVRTLLSREVAEMAEQIAVQLNTVVFTQKIRGSVAVAEAPAHGESILNYAPKSTSAQDYISLIDEILKRLKSNE